MIPTPQQQIILDSMGDVIVSAPPGTGKTTVALLKAAQDASSLNPRQKVLFLTFSNSAVESITLTRTRVLGKTLMSGKLKITNFHQFALELLQSYGGAAGFGSPLRIVDKLTELYLSNFETGDTAKKGYISFDEFVPSLNSIFQLNNSLQQVIASLYPIIIVDEFQDTDSGQWELIKRIGAEAKIICLGDPDQMIYEWRGASAERFNEFRSWKPTAVVQPLDLEQNCHRFSSQKIIQIARLLRNNETLPSWVNQRSEVVHLAGWYNKNQCKAELVSFIHRVRSGGAKTIAVLCRSNDTARKVSSWLKDSTVGGHCAVAMPHYFQTPERHMEVAIAILRALALFIDSAAYNNSGDIIKALHWLGLIPVALSNRNPPGNNRITAQNKLWTLANRLANNQPVPSNLSRFTNQIHQIVYSYLWPAQSAVELYEKVLDLPYISSFVRDAEELLGSAIRQLCARFSFMGTEDRMRTHIDMADSIAAAYHAERSHGKPKPLTVMTMHQAKGREYDAIIFMYSAFGRTPSNAQEADAEYRLYYTAVTRAKHRVLLLVQHRPRRR